MASLRKTALIAPCGLNCSTCSGYLRKRNPCPGCRGEDARKPTYCASCQIATCKFYSQGQARFCFACESFPCKRLKQLDKRYRTKYAVSLIGNLESIRELGIRRFVAEEKVRWTCPECGGPLCVHRENCFDCGKKIRELGAIG